MGPHENTRLTAVAIQAVTDDMAAIFGSDSRAPSDTPVATGPSGTRSRLPGLLTMAVAAGVLAATIGVGFYAGSNVTTSPSAMPAFNSKGDGLRSDGRLKSDAEAKMDHPMIAAPRHIPPASPVATISRQELVSVPSAPAAASVVLRSPPLTPTVPSAAKVVARTVSHAIAMPHAPPLADASPKLVCDDDYDACTEARIDTADQQVAIAYEQAIRAGVRSRDLRGYRSEWNRARLKASERPRYALRLFAMIRSDLLNLAEDAGAPDDAAER